MGIIMVYNDHRLQMHVQHTTFSLLYTKAEIQKKKNCFPMAAFLCQFQFFCGLCDITELEIQLKPGQTGQINGNRTLPAVSTTVENRHICMMDDCLLLNLTVTFPNVIHQCFSGPSNSFDVEDLPIIFPHLSISLTDPHYGCKSERGVTLIY